MGFQISIETNMDTLYWCKIFRAPILQDKHHIVGYEALLSKDRYIKCVDPFCKHCAIAGFTIEIDLN